MAHEHKHSPDHTLLLRETLPTRNKRDRKNQIPQPKTQKRGSAWKRRKKLGGNVNDVAVVSDSSVLLQGWLPKGFYSLYIVAVVSDSSVLLQGREERNSVEM